MAWSTPAKLRCAFSLSLSQFASSCYSCMTWYILPLQRFRASWMKARVAVECIQTALIWLSRMCTVASSFYVSPVWWFASYSERNKQKLETRTNCFKNSTKQIAGPLQIDRWQLQTGCYWMLQVMPKGMTKPKFKFHFLPYTSSGSWKIGVSFRGL
jgi:hypothetical protein